MQKHIYFILVLFGLSLNAHAQTLKTDSWAAVKKKGSGTVLVAYYETPNLIEKVSGKYDGVCVDIMQSFVEHLKKTQKVNVTLKYKDQEKNFKTFYAGMKKSSGGVFGLGNLTITAERKKEISFSEPFMTNVAILVTQKSAPSLMNLKDMGNTFKGMKAYVAKGTTHDKVMTALKTQYFKTMPITYTTSSTESLEQVLRDDKAFCYQDLVIYFDAVEDKKPIKRHSVGDRSGESFGIMMPPNSDWAPVFNEFLKGFVKSSEYRKILLAHLGPDALNIMDAASK